MCTTNNTTTKNPDTNNGSSDSQGSSSNSSGNSSTNGNSSNGSSNSNNQGQWNIIPEIGDGACLLRCISRRVHNTPDLHNAIRTDILAHISQNLHTIVPNSGNNTLYDSISAGINIENLQVAGHPPTTYSSVHDYLQFMSHPYAYATNIEMIAASQLYGIEFRFTFHGHPYPEPPSENVCDVLYYPSSLHYATLQYTSP